MFIYNVEIICTKCRKKGHLILCFIIIVVFVFLHCYASNAFQEFFKDFFFSTFFLFIFNAYGFKTSIELVNHGTKQKKLYCLQNNAPSSSPRLLFS